MSLPPPCEILKSLLQSLQYACLSDTFELVIQGKSF